MKYKKSIKSIFKVIDAYNKMDDDLWNTYKEPVYELRYRKWNDVNWENLRQVAFELITGESDFDEFYDRFETSAFAEKNLKPVAWDNNLTTSFIPDYISDVIFNINMDLSVDERIKEIKKQYQRCKRLERNFKKKK